MMVYIKQAIFLRTAFVSVCFLFIGFCVGAHGHNEMGTLVETHRLHVNYTVYNVAPGEDGQIIANSLSSPTLVSLFVKGENGMLVETHRKKLDGNVESIASDENGQIITGSKLIGNWKPGTGCRRLEPCWTTGSVRLFVKGGSGTLVETHRTKLGDAVRSVAFGENGEFIAGLGIKSSYWGMVYLFVKGENGTLTKTHQVRTYQALNSVARGEDGDIITGSYSHERGDRGSLRIYVKGENRTLVETHRVDLDNGVEWVVPGEDDEIITGLRGGEGALRLYEKGENGTLVETYRADLNEGIVVLDRCKNGDIITLSSGHLVRLFVKGENGRLKQTHCARSEELVNSVAFDENCQIIMGFGLIGSGPGSVSLFVKSENGGGKEVYYTSLNEVGKHAASCKSIQTNIMDPDPAVSVQFNQSIAESSAGIPYWDALVLMVVSLVANLITAF